MSCAMSTIPCEFANARQAVSGWTPRTMLTPRVNSLIATTPLPSQSPVQDAADLVGVEVAVSGAVGLTVAVAGLVGGDMAVLVAVVVGAAEGGAVGVSVGVELLVGGPEIGRAHV